ncbi:MAG: hypothetical protein N2260_03575 [Syntrophobacterales bacterium]|nr:hypothetical protein [Syntrophobacterales bacterium]
MESLGRWLSDLWEIIKTYNFQKILQLVHSIDWIELAKSPISWTVAGVILFIIVLTKRYKYIIVALSIVAFVFLMGKTLPSDLENLEIKNLLGFFLGTIVIAALDFYLLFIRE